MRWILLSLLATAVIPQSGCPVPGDADDSDDDAADDDAAGPGWDSCSFDPGTVAVWTGDLGAVDADRLDDFDVVVLPEAGAEALEPLAADLAGRGVQVYAWLEAGAPRAPAEIDGVLAAYGQGSLHGVTLAGLGLEVQGNNPARPIMFANTARGHGLSVMMTAPVPADVMGQIDGLGQAVTAGDRFLLQDFAWAGGWQDEAQWRALVQEATSLASACGATVVATASGDWDEAAFRYAFFAAWLDGLEAVGWRGPPSAALVSPLPFPGTAGCGAGFTSEVNSAGSVYSRATDTGTIVVDAGAHEARFE